MASAETKAEQVRIRTALEIGSYDLAQLERFLINAGHIPASDDEQSISDAVFSLRQCYHYEYQSHRLYGERLNLPLDYFGAATYLFSAWRPGHEPPDLLDSAQFEQHKMERESVKYDAVRDLTAMIATRQVQAAKAAQHQQAA